MTSNRTKARRAAATAWVGALALGAGAACVPLPVPHTEQVTPPVAGTLRRSDGTPVIGGEAFFPHAHSTLLRLVPAAEFAPDAGPDASAPALPSRRVVGWTPAADLPGWEELRELGVELDDEEADTLADGDLPHAGDKLGGSPLWVQNVEYPACRRCGRRMELLFQVDSDQGVAWAFGDAGVGHVTQCAEHRDELAFGWACG